MGYFWEKTPRAYLWFSLGITYMSICIVFTLIYTGHIDLRPKAEIPLALCKQVTEMETSNQPAEMDDNRASQPPDCQLRSETLLPKNRPHMMSVSRKGRMGNQLFQYAVLLSIARRFCYTPVVHAKPTYELAQFFELPDLKLVHVNMSNEELFSENSAFGNYNPRLLELPTEYNWSLVGYFQSWKYHDYFKKSDIIFKPDILRSAENFMTAKGREGKSNVCIHVRRTDFALGPMISRGFAMADKGYIHRAMTYFRTNVTKAVQFIVLSDDMRWCKANIAGGDVIYSTFTNPGMDMALMSLCDHVIVTSGSFGWWGGRLCPGEVVYWKGYPAPNSTLSRRLIPSDYYPPHWKGMW